MAGERMFMRTDLDTDPRVLRVAFELKIDLDLVIGKLWRLWSFADRNTEDGVLHLMLPEMLDTQLSCPGLCGALCAVGWLIVDNDAITIPRFTEYHGRSARKRLRDAQRMYAKRHPSENGGKQDGDTGATPERQKGDALRQVALSESESESEKKKKTLPSGEKKKRGEARSYFCPDDFALTDELRAYAQTCGLDDAAVDAEWEKFRTFEFDKPKFDWARCWKRWCRTAVEIRARNGGGPASGMSGLAPSASHEAARARAEAAREAMVAASLADYQRELRDQAAAKRKAAAQ